VKGALEEVFAEVSRNRDYAVNILTNLIKIRAVNPAFGGEGEFKRCLYLEKVLRELSPDSLQIIDVPDSRVPEGVRRNIVAIFEGSTRERLWIIAHTDTVPEGDRSLWKSDPYTPIISDGKIFGRGAEDNGQAIASSILAVKALRDAGIKPRVRIGLVFAADEEAGSTYGIKALMRRNTFGKSDLIVVPDAGSPKGDFIEVAEKHILWLKITVVGRQAHASMPHMGINAHRIGMKFALLLDEVLHAKFHERNELFSPPTSTFEPTKKEKNIDNVNTIPGVDVVYFDCRVLPGYDLNEVLEIVHTLKENFEKVYRVRINVEVIARSEAPPPTSPQSKVVQKLKTAIKLVTGLDARVGGIGGGTFAAIFRRVGYQAAVWSTVDETAHQPNEYARIANILQDAKVFATMALI